MKRAPSIPRADKEAVLQASRLTEPEARFAVANYYQAQDMRKRADMQIRHLGDKELPSVLQYTADSNAIIEHQVQRSLESYAKAKPVGRWMLAQFGIGPVISAGLLAYLAIELPQLDIAKNTTEDCTLEYSTGNQKQKIVFVFCCKIML